MKTNYFFLAVAAALLMISCSKEELNHASGGSDPAAGGVKSTIHVSTEDMTKADFNQTEASGPYKISWEEDDEVVILQQLSTGYDNTMNVFTYDGSEFSGTIDSPCAGSKWHAFFPADNFSNWNKAANRVKANLSHNQNGTKSAFNTCYLMYRVNKNADGETPSGQEAGTALSAVDLSFNLKGLSSVIKLNVPSELNLKTITLTAKDESDNDVYLAGDITLYTGKGNHGLLNSPPDRKGDQTAITVDAGEGTFSSDVYLYLLPDTRYYDSGTGEYYYYSTARTLNFQFANADGFTCTRSVSIAADHPLKTGTLYSFGSLPSALPFEFDFSLTLSTDATPVLTPTGAPDGTVFYYTYTTDGSTPADPTTSSSTTAPTMANGRYVKVLAHKDGLADKMKVAYVRGWSFGPDSDFWSNAVANGVTSGTTTTSDISFDTDGLTFSLVSGGKLTVGDGAVGNNYTQFNGKDKNNRPLLDFTPIHASNACYYLRLAANGTSVRNTFLYKDGSEIQTIASNANTSAVSRVYSVGPVTTSTAMQVQIGYNGPRLFKLFWLEWDDNLINPNASPEAESESLSGTQEYGI